MLFGLHRRQAVLPAQRARQFQLLVVIEGQGFQGAYAKGAEHRVTPVTAAFQGGGIAFFVEGLTVQVHVGQVGERLQRQRLQVNAVRGFGEQLRRGRIKLGFLLAADVTPLQVALHVAAMPAVGTADTQAPVAQLAPGVRAKVVAVDGRR